MTPVTVITVDSRGVAEESPGHADVYVGCGTEPVQLILHLRHEGRELRVVLDPLVEGMRREIERLPAARGG